MRRTYRSKKDTTNIVDRRDLFQNLDGKSTAYDAFSIQNIKQTKRELSCVGSSNPFGVASKKVRKKKYVKRIIKETETPCKDISQSTYLTPDKSIHVNKALDPFDLLLMSSPAGPAKTENKVQSVTNKVDLFDHVTEKECKTYVRRKPKRIKKFNYSTSESSDSDKENSENRPNITQNTSDIRSHKLLVEREVIPTPNKVDESINKIVNNISLLNRIKNKYINDNSINKSFKYNRHRLTKTIQSPLLQKSPLCSTPFKVKYRGESIFKFSPIAGGNEDGSPAYMTIREDNIDSIQENVNSTVQGKPNKSIKLVLADKIDSEANNESSINIDAEDVIIHAEKAESIDQPSNLVNDSKVIPSIEVSSLQTTENEPFLGFSHNAAEEPSVLNNYRNIRTSLSDESVLANDATAIEVSENESNRQEDLSNHTISENEVTRFMLGNSQYLEDNQYIDEHEDETSNGSIDLTADGEENNSGNDSDRQDHSKEIDVETQSNVSSDFTEENNDENLSLKSIDNCKDSLYDTCASEQSFLQDSENVKQSVVRLQRMNDSSFYRYYDKVSQNSQDNIHDNSEVSDKDAGSLKYLQDTENIKEAAVCLQRMNDSSFYRYYDKVSQKSQDNIHDNSEVSDKDAGSLKYRQDTENIKEAAVCLQRMNDSSFYRYYDKVSQNSEANTSCISDLSNEDSGNLNAHQNIAKIREAAVCLEKMNDSSFFKYYDKMSEKLETSTLDESETSDDNEGNLQSLEDTDNIKEAAVCIQRMNDSSFYKYYDKITQNQEANTSCRSQDSAGDEGSVISEFISIKESNDSNASSRNVSDIESDAEDDFNRPDIDETGDNSEDKDSHSTNEEEKCVSFVTTRRRNEVVNDSIISMFNDSYCSTSTDCDKTVLSNNIEKTEVNNLDDKNTTIGLDVVHNNEAVSTSEITKSPEHLYKSEEEIESRISFVTTRNSFVTDRKSSMKSKNSTVNPNQSNKLPRASFRQDGESSRLSCFDTKPAIVLQPGKKWERSLSIYRRMTMMNDHFDRSMLDETDTTSKGRKYRQSIINTMEMQDLQSSLHNESINSRRSTFVSKPSRSTILIVKDPNRSRYSLCNTTVFDDLKGFWNEECDDTIIELSKLSITDSTHEVTVLDNFHDTPNRIATARDYVLRRCNQTDAILFDECYPDTVLKNCHKIGEGVYGEVFLWRDRDGRARVLKIVPIAGNLKVNGESQKDFHEIISEIVIAMELSALRAPIAEIERHFDEGKDVEALDLHTIENASDIFNEVLAVRCVYGSYPSRLLDLWDLYDECKGSENDNPAILPVDQQFIVLELANAGQDLESYQFNNAEQAHALFLQVAYGLAVAEEAFQFEHRDLHWGNVLISPTEKKWATFVIRGRLYRVARCGVSATIIDYSLSRVSLRLAAGDSAALYNDLATDESLFDAVGDYQFQVYRLMRDKLGNDWKNFEPYTNILWLHYTVDKMITALRYKRTNTKIHKHYIDKLKGIKSRILDYGSAAQFVLTDNEI